MSASTLMISVVYEDWVSMLAVDDTPEVRALLNGLAPLLKECYVFLDYYSTREGADGKES